MTVTTAERMRQVIRAMEAEGIAGYSLLLRALSNEVAELEKTLDAITGDASEDEQHAFAARVRARAIARARNVVKLRPWQELRPG